MGHGQILEDGTSLTAIAKVHMKVIYKLHKLCFIRMTLMDTMLVLINCVEAAYVVDGVRVDCVF